MKKFYRGFCKAEEITVAALFFFMVCLVFSSAGARGLKHPIAWSLDIAQLLLAWCSFLGADVTLRYGGFIGLDIVTRRLPEKMQKIVKILVMLVMMTVLCIAAYYATTLGISNWKRKFQALGISYSWVNFSLSVASLLMLITSTIQLVGYVRDLIRPKQDTLPDEKATAQPEAE